MKTHTKNPFLTGVSILALAILLSGCVPYAPYYYNNYNTPVYNNPGYYNSGYYSGPVTTSTYYTPNYYYGTGWGISPSIGFGVGF